MHQEATGKGNRSEMAVEYKAWKDLINQFPYIVMVMFL